MKNKAFKLALCTTLATFIFAFPEYADAQQSKVPLDKSFVDHTIEYYYTKLAKQQNGSVVFFVELDSLTKNAKTDYPTFKVQFLSASEAARKIVACAIMQLSWTGY